MKQTAVEFLSEKYMYVTWLTNRDEITTSEADKMRIKYFEQAKEMEMHQIIEAFEEGFFDERKGKNADAEQYYNAKFKNKL